ncbi:nicotinate phosphoribosyltransferase [Nocardia sp. NPDC051787]|uniref:nicotinate phosphoribosyltransferase n=1 Tax=Nocardia sp. NPDC051787 TaxID=3155415 RepID=UPI003423FF6A
MPGALLTDLYELNMAASYLRRRMIAPATFSLFVRKLPANRGFLVAAGVSDCLDWLEQFSFTPADLDYLASIGFDDDSLESFAPLRFSGDVWGVPEGRMVFAGEPIYEVTAPIAEGQLVETYLLNQVSLQTTLATKAARCRIAAAARIELVDFSFRRTQGIEAGLAAARLTGMVGFTATSNVEAARRYGLRPAGTMAHSYIEAFPTELDAFYAFVADHPGQATFLVDTYDTLGGVAHAIEVIDHLGLHRHAAIRLDSGDLAALAVCARRMLDRAGMPEVRIFASGGLDENDLAAFVSHRVPIDAVGVGTRMGVSADAPYLDSAYKLVAYDGRAVAKLSTGKATLPGPKQVYRGHGMRDVIARRDEPRPDGTYPLLEPIMRDGQRVSPMEAVAAGRARFEADLAQLPDEARDLRSPVAPIAAITPRLRQLTDEVQDAARRLAGTVDHSSVPE